MSKEAFKRSWDRLSGQMDETEELCVEAAEKQDRGEELTETERRRLEAWDRVGRERWRKTPRLLAKIRKAAKIAARNERRMRGNG